MIVTEDPIQVIEVVGNRVKIHSTRLSMCAHCHLHILPFETQILEFWIEDHVGVQPGDTVQSGMSSRHFLLTVGIVFGLPLMGLLGGISLAPVMYSYLHLPLSPTLWQAFLGFAGMGLSLIGLHRFDRYVRHKPVFLPGVVKKIRVKPKLLQPQLDEPKKIPEQLYMVELN